MVGFYKHEITSWMDGTADLSDRAYRAYHVICQMIYANEGPIKLNEYYIAGACRQPIKTFRAALKELVEGSKITVSDGRIDNSRTAQELLLIGKTRVNARDAGIKSGEARRTGKNSNKNNGNVERSLPKNRTEKTRLDETREDERVGPAPEAAAPLKAPAPPEETAAPAAKTRRKSAAEPKQKSLIPKVATPLPEDWGPSTANNDYARKVGLTELEMAREAKRFRNHCLAKGLVFKDWNAAWRNWCDKALEFLGRAPKEPPPPPVATKVFDEATWRSILRIYATTNNWNTDLGPAPGEPGCRVPPHLMPSKQPELL